MEADDREQSISGASQPRSVASRRDVAEAGAGRERGGGATGFHHRPGEGERRRQPGLPTVPGRHRPVAPNQCLCRKKTWYPGHISQLEHDPQARGGYLRGNTLVSLMSEVSGTTFNFGAVTAREGTVHRK